MSGSFVKKLGKVQGNRLIMTNNTDGSVQNYSIDDGNWNLRLKLVSTNAFSE